VFKHFFVIGAVDADNWDV